MKKLEKVTKKIDGKLKYNLIDTNGKYISEQWFDNIQIFYDGYACVGVNSKWNWIDMNGNMTNL